MEKLESAIKKLKNYKYIEENSSDYNLLELGYNFNIQKKELKA